MDKISVVVATYKRRDTLRRTLEHLRQQTLSADQFEVIVCDDGSNDGTQELVSEVARAFPCSLRYFGHTNRGPGYTQNVGIRQARHELVLLLADDIWAVPELVAEHLSSHQSRPEPHVAVLGHVVQSPELPQNAIHRVWQPFQCDRFQAKQELDGVYFHAYNISVKKSFLLTHGLFKEPLGAAHEDVELGYRLGKCGLRILYNPRAKGEHYHPETLEGICKRAYERGRNFGVLTDNLPPQVVFPLYKILSWKVGWKTWLKMLPREIVRSAVFNRFLVRGFWLPVLSRADTSNWVRLCASEYAYRGVAGYYQRQGIRHQKTRRVLPDDRSVGN